METPPAVSLQGELHLYPFGSIDRMDTVTERYLTLQDEHSADDVLCLTRLCNEQELTDSIATADTGIGSPNVSTLRTFATEILQTLTPGLTQLSDHERIELLASFLDEYEWDTPYLAEAAELESFQQDVGELLIEMESRNRLDPAIYDSPILQEIATVGAAFQTRLAEREYVDRPSIIPRATEQLTTRPAAELPQFVTKPAVVLVADFEELAETERRFLAAVTEAADAQVVGVAERDSRLLSSWRETGAIDARAAGLTVTSHSSDRPSLTAPESVGTYLATGEHPEATVDTGSVQVIETATFREQITAVADEIERLCRTSEYTYADIAIAYQDSSGPLEQTIRLLRRHGVPTTTVAVSQLGNDPAVKELYDLTTICASETAAEAHPERRERLLAHDDATPELLATLSETDTAVDGLWHWIETTQLKHRTASEWTELEARDQFQRVKDVTRLAEFLATESELDGSWQGFLPALERAFRYSSSRLENIESPDADGRVSVGTIYGHKHTRQKAVFLLNVTDEEYPFTPDMTALIPQQRLETESQYPMLTAQTPPDVTDTFQPATEPPADPFHAYYTQISRRLLGVGARAATDRLYLGVPSESANSLGTYLQPSRFLSDLVETVPFIEPFDESGEATNTSHGGASEYVVEQIDDTLEAVRRASVGGETVDLDAYERELAAIDDLLDQPAAATVQEALAARIDFRQGRVRRD